MSLVINRQIKAARALLAWGQQHLADAAGVNVQTVKRMEGIDGPVRGQHDTVIKIQRAMEEAGIEFLADGAPGVRLKRALD